MARVTIEDSMKNVPNLFYLIQLAAFRAHQLQRGATPKIPVHETEDGRVDAPTVFALREIAAGFVDFENEVIPQKDAWGNDVPVREHTPKTVELYAVRSKSTGEILKTGMTLDEATEFKGKLVERLVEKQKEEENKDV